MLPQVIHLHNCVQFSAVGIERDHACEWDKVVCKNSTAKSKMPYLGRLSAMFNIHQLDPKAQTTIRIPKCK